MTGYFSLKQLVFRKLFYTFVIELDQKVMNNIVKNQMVMDMMMRKAS